MYKDQGGESLEVYPGVIAHLPPVPPDSEILNIELPQHQQKWKRAEIPQWYKDRRPAELKKQRAEQELVDRGEMERILHHDPMLENYRRKQWHRRKNGVWVMINGTPRYLTGDHWFYLQWCQFDHSENNGYPLFYSTQIKRYYFRQVCYENPFCLGYVIVGPRGFGKTTEEVGGILNDMTQPPRRSKAAVQSKSEDDAKTVIFKEKMVPCFNSLPEFFKPRYNHGSNPENKLSFYRDTTRGKGAISVVYGEDIELENLIYPVAAQEKTLDGGTYQEILEDEIGKTDPKKIANVQTRAKINRFCVFRNNRKIGIIRSCSTVEEMDKGGKECHELWKDSNPKEVNENGFTISGRFRFFVSAIDTATQFADEFGDIDEEKAMVWHMVERESRKKNSKDYGDWIRKNPLFEEEAFLKDPSQSIFNVPVLTSRLNQLHSLRKPLYVIGNLYYVNGKKDTTVDFANDQNGRWRFGKLMDMTKKSNRFHKANNLTSYYDGEKRIWVPLNSSKLRLSMDPIKYKRTKDPRASKAAIHGFELYNAAIDAGVPMENWKTHNYFMEYIHRPDDPEIFLEDIIMTLRYCGCAMLPETNISDFLPRLEERGYLEHFIYGAWRVPDIGKQNNPGVSTTDEITDRGIKKLQSFINRHGHRVIFERTIQDWLDFDATMVTLYDATVSSWFGLLATEVVDEGEDVEMENLEEWMPVYDNSGEHGKLVDEFDNFEGENDISTIFD